jgi:hypothetical protein
LQRGRAACIALRTGALSDPDRAAATGIAIPYQQLNGQLLICAGIDPRLKIFDSSGFTWE